MDMAALIEGKAGRVKSLPSGCDLIIIRQIMEEGYRPERSRSWFAPKRYGYGSGLPIAWQGWVVLAACVLINTGDVFVLWKIFPDFVTFIAAIVVSTLASTIILMIICARTTKDGWRWRDGDET